MAGGRHTWRWAGLAGTSIVLAVAIAGASPPATAGADDSSTLPVFEPPHQSRFAFTLQPIALPTGYSATFLGANDSTNAVGFELNGKAQDPIYLSGGTLTNLQPLLGNGYLDALAAPGYAVGQAAGHPVFYDPGSPPITLGVSGVATSVTLGPLVGVTTTTSGAPDMAELWQPYSGGTLSLGAARIGGLDAGGWVVGQTDTGRAWYAAPTGGGSVGEWTLPFAGYLRGVNDFNWAWGYRVSDGGPEPIVLDFTSTSSYRSVDFKVSLGFKWGELLGVNYGGLAVGEEFKTLRDFKLGLGTPVYYPDGPSHPITLRSDIPHLTLSALSSLSDNNFMFGFAASRSVQGGHLIHIYGEPVMLLPPIPGKLADLEDILDFDTGLFQSEWTQAADGIQEVESDVDQADDAAACAAISGVGSDIEDFSDYLEGYYGDDASEAVDTLDDLDDVLYELYGELNCTGALTLPLLGLSAQQSPYYNTALAPLTSPGETITTTIGPITITGG